MPDQTGPRGRLLLLNMHEPVGYFGRGPRMRHTGGRDRRALVTGGIRHGSGPAHNRLGRSPNQEAPRGNGNPGRGGHEASIPEGREGAVAGLSSGFAILEPLSLTGRDNHRLRISTSAENAYVYIFQQDHYGEVRRIFPDPVWSKGIDNPIHGGKEYTLPSDREWYYPDQLPASQTGSIMETI